MVKYLMGVCVVAASLGLAACGSSQGGTVAKAVQPPAGQVAPAEGAPQGVPTSAEEIPQKAPEANSSRLKFYEKASGDEAAVSMAMADQVWQGFAKNPLFNVAGSAIDGINLTDIRQGTNLDYPTLTMDAYGARFGECVSTVSVTVHKKSTPFFQAGQPVFAVELYGPIVMIDKGPLDELNAGRTSLAEVNDFLAANHDACFD